MTTCVYCKKFPPIENSHIVSSFLIRHIKKNGTQNFLFNSWNYNSNLKLQDGYKMPLLCKECDNETFSQWETNFSKHIFEKRFIQEQKNAKVASIFFASILFRYAQKFIMENPNSENHKNNLHFSDLSYSYLLNTGSHDRRLFIYPYLYREILDEGFSHGINHLLRLSTHAQSLPSEAEDVELPNGFLIILPDMIVLFTDEELSNFQSCSMTNPTSIDECSQFAFSDINTDLPLFLSSPLNNLVNQTKSYQSTIKTKIFAEKIKRKLMPNKIIWKTRDSDFKLKGIQNHKT